MINIGSLDKRITFVGRQKQKNEIGQTELVQGDIKTVWARIEPARGREYYEAHKVKAENTYKITTRYHQNITPDMQIKYKERLFEIQTIINPYMQNEKLEIMCIEKVKK